jgi:putative hemolysin
MIVLIVSCSVAIGVSFLCSLAEAVLLSANPVRMEILEQEGKAHAAAWRRLRGQVGRPIAAILILNTIAHTGGATIAGGAFDELYGERWLWLFSSLFTFIILFGTEIFPKVIGVVHGERLSRVVVPGLEILIRLLHPLILVTEKFSNLLGGDRKTTEFVSVADIQSLTRSAVSHGVLAEEQANIIINAARLRELKVRDAMVPREWIVLFKDRIPLSDNFAIARGTMHTRYPVTGTEDADGIFGYINIKEVALAAHHGGPLRMEDFLRSVLFVAPGVDINTMLRLFIAKHHHLAVVKGEDGRVVGMVTLENLIEELAGEIENEFDAGNAEVVRFGDRTWRVGGTLRFETLARRLAAPLPDSAIDPGCTLDQWFRAQTGSRPAPGQQRVVGPWRLTVQQVRRNRVHQVMLEIT